MKTLELVYEGGMMVKCAPARRSANPALAVDVAYVGEDGSVAHLTSAEYDVLRGRAPVRKVLGIAIVSAEARPLAW